MYCASTLTIKAYQVSAGVGKFQVYFLNIVMSAAVFVVFLIIKGFSLYFTVLTLILSISFGVGLAAYNGAKVKAAGCGPMAIISMSYVIGGVTFPSLYGIIILKEPIIIHKLIGIFLIFLSFLPLILKSKDKMVFSFKFWIYCITLLVLNGVLMTVSKVAQLEYGDPQYSIDFIALYYFFFFVVSIIDITKNLHHIDPYDIQVTFTTRHLLLAGAAGLLNAGASVFNYLISFRLPASVQFPLIQSSMLVVVTITTLILYHEKLNKATVISLLITIASIILISI